jgi:hypothetical protein
LTNREEAPVAKKAKRFGRIYSELNRIAAITQPLTAEELQRLDELVKETRAIATICPPTSSTGSSWRSPPRAGPPPSWPTGSECTGVDVEAVIARGAEHLEQSPTPRAALSSRGWSPVDFENPTHRARLVYLMCGHQVSDHV